ncbi:hypothetical protein HPB50_020839 [Hyalomma asiaticum]|uniref:Uncharacterized protein n=1 Tax=Hyalomma asiaticum TaxID=266040 RepID=A0ACB7RW74_HYAAI|nr:hypothetical protein HPB50_020839 [Hyalomma asiaticum]
MDLLELVDPFVPHLHGAGLTIVKHSAFIIHIDKAIRVARIPGVNKHINGYDHVPTVDPMKNARCCRLPGCPSRSRTRCNCLTRSELNGTNGALTASGLRRWL